MPFALVNIRPEPYYRRAAIEDGLKRLGYTIRDPRVNGPAMPKSRDDLTIFWNLKVGADESAARTFEARGGTAIVVENAYLQREDKSRYAISVHGHCGSGWFPFASAENRFTELGFPLELRSNFAGHILVCGQRSIGSSTMASPRGWAERETVRLRNRHLDREVRLRRHPGNAPAKVPLERDLDGASRCVIWSSSAGVRALTMGIPVTHHAPHWIAAGDAHREDVLNRVAHGQWSVAEIAAGEPFARMRDAGWGPSWA